MAFNSLSEALRSPDFSGLSSEAKQYVFDKYSANDTAFNSLSEDAKAHVKEKYLGSVTKAEPKIGRKTGIMEDIGIGLENVAHKGKTALDLLAGAAATYAGYQEDADKIYAGMEARQKAREAELAKLDQGTGGKIISGITGIAPAIVAAPFVGVPAALGGMAGMSALASGGENVGKGAGVPEATAQAMLEAGTDYASLKIPVGRGVMQGAALGAGGNVAGTLATDYTGRQLMEGTEAAQAYETTPEKLLVSAATGAIPGAVFGKFNQRGQLETKPTATAEPDPYFERVVRQEERQTAREQVGVQPPISEEPIRVTPEGQAITDTNMEFFKKQAEERQAAATEEARTAELAAIDETMMQYPKDLQAPQYGMGGKIARHEDQVSRVKGKFEPGERTGQIGMDLDRQRVLQEEQQRLLDEDAAWKVREQELTQERGVPLSKEEAFAQADERRIALEEQKQRQSQLDRIESELAGVQERLMKEPTQKLGQGPKTLAAKQLTLGEATANLVDSLAEFTGAKMNFLPGEGLGKSVVEFVRALGREGHTTYQKAVAAAKNALGDGWESIKQFFKKAWDYVRQNPETKEVDLFENYAKNIRSKYPNATDEQITKAWELKTSDAADKIALQQKGAEANKVASKLMHQAQRTGEVWTPEQQIQIYQTIPDAKIGLVVENVTAAGSRIQSELIDHPVVTQDINLVNRSLEEAEVKAHHVLDDVKTGIFSKIDSFVATSKAGYNQMKSYFRWKFENEGNPNAKLPDTFSNQVREINDLEGKASDNLLKAMNEVLAKDGKEPIQKIDNHMVHYFVGKYRAFIYVKDANGNSRIAFPIAEQTEADAKRAVAWVKKNIPNVDEKLSSDIKFVGADARSRASTFDLLLDMSNQKDPMVLDALTTFKDRIAAAQERHLSEQFRQKKRTGAEGYLGNKPWMSEHQNYLDSLDVLRRKYEAGYEWVAAQKVRQAREPVLQAQNDGVISVGNALAFGQRYIDHAFGRNIDTSFITKMMDAAEERSPLFAGTGRRVINEVHNKANHVIYPVLLGGKLSSAAQATGQLVIATVPRMMHDIGLEGNKWNPVSYAKGGIALAQGLFDGAFQLFNTVSLSKFEKYQNELYALGEKYLPESMNLQKSKEIYQSIRDQDISRISLTETPFLRRGGQIKTITNVALDALLKAPMTLVESPFRAAAYSAFARRALMEGYDMPTALAMARENMDSMVNYGRRNASMGLGKIGPIGNEARGLHTFTINLYSQLAHYTNVALKSKNPAPLLAMLAGVYFTAGAVGMFGVDLVDALLDGIKAASRGKSWDSPELQNFSMRKWIMESDTPDWHKFGGLSSSTGLGLYGSFGTKFMDPDRGLLDNLFPKGMFALELGKSALSAHKLLTDETLSRGEKGQILESIAPKAFTQRIRNEYQNIVQKNPETGESTGATVFSPFKTGPVYQRNATEQQISEQGMGTRALPEMAALERERMFVKGKANVGESKSAAEKGFKDDLEEAFKEQMRGGQVTQAQAKNILEQSERLKTRWGVTDEAMYDSVKKIQDDLKIPDPIMRRLMALKTATPNNVREAQSLMSIFKQNAEMKKRYE